jgi:hypothetical protein
MCLDIKKSNKRSKFGDMNINEDKSVDIKYGE